MTLGAGTRLGPYEIVAPLGAGGMGEVLRARDTKLGREVAIKVLPAAFAQDAERVARFRREAQILASLNHPNIAAIYGLEESEGVLALVMELVEGEDLAARLKRGAVPVDECVAIASQIAEALEEAHEKGIVHRDLKPANVKVTTEGRVKVLDFGLAKAFAGADPTSRSDSHDLSQSPTLATAAGTQAGVILGTAAYMSPEQARGKAVDKRADIWAFGVVLFEMLTGQRLFGGETVSDTLAAVLREEIPWSRLPAATPRHVAALLRRCLDRDPRRRLRDVGEARLALEDGTAMPVSPGPHTTGGPWRLAFTAAALGLVALAVPAVRHLRETPQAAPPETRVDIATPASDAPESFALSPDGRQIVYVATSDGASLLWLRSLSSASAQPLAGTEGARSPFWSPDSRSIGFLTQDALRRLDLAGGAPRTLAPVRYGAGATWNTDDTIVFWVNPSSELMRVSATGGAAAAVKSMPQHGATHFLPDGRRFVFSGRSGTAIPVGLHLGSLDGSTPKLLASGPGRPIHVLPSGWMLLQRAGALVAQRLDLAAATLVGEPVTVVDAVEGVSVSATGLIAYRAADSSRRQLTWVDRSGRALATLGEPDASLVTPRVSPDGGRVTVGRTHQGNQDVWVLDGVRMSRLTVDAAVDRYAVWSPDGTRFAFSSFRTGNADLYEAPTSGSGAVARLLASDSLTTPSSWSADGRYLLYYGFGKGIGVLLRFGGGAASELLNQGFRERDAVFSPDGKWVAYQSEESGRPEIYVRAFLPARGEGDPPALGASVLVSADGGVHPAWRADGKELYFLDPSAAMMAAPIVVRGDVVAPGVPVKLFATRIYAGGRQHTPLGRQYDVAPDGRFLINTVLDTVPAPITLIQNWNPGARQ